MITCILTIARTTFTELVRQKVFYFLVIFALLIIFGSLLVEKISFDAEFQMLKDTSLGAMSIFTSLLAILATANFLPKDLEDRTIYTTLAKPVPRYAYLMGKLGGIILMLLLATLLMAAMFLATLWIRESFRLSEVHASGLTGDGLEKELRSIKDSAFNINLLPGIAIIFAKSALLAAMTLFISTFATSTLFTIIIATAVYFIGHLQATAVDFWLQGADQQWWLKILLGAVALIFPDLQAFNLADDVVAGTAIPLALFLKTFGLGCFYVVIYYALSAFVFSTREL